MSEDSRPIIRSAQNARIILCISEMYGVSIDEATDIYYTSETANMIEEGIAVEYKQYSIRPIGKENSDEV